MRRLISIVLAAGVVVGASEPARALVGDGTGQYTFPMVCDGQTVTLTIASGRWAAAYVWETGERFVPKGTSLAVHDLETGEMLFEEADLKPSVSETGSTCVDVWEDGGALVTFQVFGKMK